MTRKKEPTPNYELLFKSAVAKLQVDYNLLKNAQIKSIRWTWFNRDGNYSELSGAMGRLREIEVLYDRVTDDLNEVNRLRARVEEVEDDKG